MGLLGFESPVVVLPEAPFLLGPSLSASELPELRDSLCVLLLLLVLVRDRSSAASRERV